MSSTWIIVVMYVVGLLIGGVFGWFLAKGWYIKKLHANSVAQQKFYEEQRYNSYYPQRPSQWVN